VLFVMLGAGGVGLGLGVDVAVVFVLTGMLHFAVVVAVSRTASHSGVASPEHRLPEKEM